MSKPDLAYKVDQSYVKLMIRSIASGKKLIRNPDDHSEAKLDLYARAMAVLMTGFELQENEELIYTIQSFINQASLILGQGDDKIWPNI